MLSNVEKGKLIRWMHQLNPKLNRDKWQIEDSKKLFVLHRIHRNRWKTIAENFAGRTDNSIKNQFFSVVRKALRKACKVLGNISNTHTINKIKPKVLSNYLCMDYEITINSGSPNHLKISLNDFVQKFAFTKYNDLARNLTSDDLLVIDKCIDYLNKLNEGYIKKKHAKIRNETNMTGANLLVKANQNYSQVKGEGLSSNNGISESSHIFMDLPNTEDKVSIKLIANVTELIERFQRLLVDLETIKQSEGNSEDKLITFFNELGDLSYCISNTLQTNDKGHIDRELVNTLLDMAKKAYDMLSVGSKTNIKESPSENHFNFLHNLCSDKTTQKITETTTDDHKELKLDKIFIRPVDVPITPNTITPLTINKSINQIEMPKPRFDFNIRTPTQITDFEYTSGNKYQVDKYGNPKNFPIILSSLRSPFGSEQELEKRSYSAFKQLHESNDCSKHLTIENISSPDLNSHFLVKHEEEGFGQLSKRI